MKIYRVYSTRNGMAHEETIQADDVSARDGALTFYRDSDDFAQYAILILRDWTRCQLMEP